MAWYIKAFEHSQRAEPLLYIAIYYINVKFWVMAYTFLKLACSLAYPSEAILFVNRHDYDYKRFHLLGIVAYYIHEYNDGKIACLKAIDYCERNKHQFPTTDIDRKNLKFYEDKEIELAEKSSIDDSSNTLGLIQPELAQPLSVISPEHMIYKKEFMEQKLVELRRQFPKASDKQIFTKANMMWKNREKLMKQQGKL